MRECALSLSHHPFPFTNSVHSTRRGKNASSSSRVHATQWQILCDARLFSAPLISAAKHRANFLILCARLKNDTLGYWLVSSPPLDEKIWLADLGLCPNSILWQVISSVLGTVLRVAYFYLRVEILSFPATAIKMNWRAGVGWIFILLLFLWVYALLIFEGRSLNINWRRVLLPKLFWHVISSLSPLPIFGTEITAGFCFCTMRRTYISNLNSNSSKGTS